MARNNQKEKKVAYRFNEYAMQVLDLIRTEGPITRRELADYTQLNRSTLSEVIVRLKSQSLIHDTGNYKSVDGRRFRTLEINGGTRSVVVGIEFTGDKTHTLLVNLACEVLWCEDRSIPRGSTKEEITAFIESAIKAALRMSIQLNAQVMGIGHADVGLVSATEECIVMSSVSPNWRDVPLKKMLAEKFDLPIFIQNVGNTMVLAEGWWGVGKGFNDILYVYLSNGIGVAYYRNGEVLNGATNCLGELGHTIVDKDGPLCACGSRGCLEAMAGGEAIMQKVKNYIKSGVRTVLSNSSNYNLSKLELDDVVRAAQEGDKLCTTMLGEASTYLSIGVVNAVNLFNPAILIFGGTLSKSHLVIDTIKRSIKAKCLPNVVGELKMEISTFGDDGPALGAATLAIRGYLSQAVLENV